MSQHGPGSELFDAAERRAIRQRLPKWFQRHARDLPWRRTTDPYRVWVSEIMLQQTQVATVARFFGRFVARFPSVSELAAADEQDVLRLWEGLGYYRRARLLHAAARQVVERHGGEFPIRFEDAVRLPGVGRYTAGAVLSIAAGARLPIVEANSQRVLARLLALDEPLASSSARRKLWRAAEELLPARRAGTFNQALMELGSLACTPRAPRCDECPVNEICRSRARGIQQQIPFADPPRAFTDLIEAAVVVWKMGKLLVRRCGSGERWAGLWDFPRFKVTSLRPGESELDEKVRRQTGVSISGARQLATIKHGVTRYRITLVCLEAQHSAGRRRGETRWLRPQDLAELPLSSTGRRIAKLIAGTSAEGRLSCPASQ